MLGRTIERTETVKVYVAPDGVETVYRDEWELSSIEKKYILRIYERAKVKPFVYQAHTGYGCYDLVSLEDLLKVADIILADQKSKDVE